MKFIGGILAFMVLFLSVQPGVESIFSLIDADCCSSDYCPFSSEQQGQAQGQADGCCGSEVCNPFLSCCTCVGATLNFSPYQISIFESIAEKITPCNSTIHSQFPPAFWQPPKIS